MKKRVISMTMAALLAVSALAGCSSNTTETTVSVAAEITEKSSEETKTESNNSRKNYYHGNGFTMGFHDPL